MSSTPKTPLEGKRVLDLGRYQAGPRCALMFARMGAEVIKVESLRGDESRRNGPHRPRTERLLGTVQQRQEEPCHQSAHRRGQGGPKRAGQGLRYTPPELPPRDDRDDGLRLRDAEGAEPADSHDKRLRLRPVRPLQRQGRLRSDRPGPGRDDVPHRLPGRTSGQDPLPADRQDHGAARHHRRPSGADGGGSSRGRDRP